MIWAMDVDENSHRRMNGLHKVFKFNNWRIDYYQLSSLKSFLDKIIEIDSPVAIYFENLEFICSAGFKLFNKYNEKHVKTKGTPAEIIYSENEDLREIVSLWETAFTNNYKSYSNLNKFKEKYNYNGDLEIIAVKNG